MNEQELQHRGKNRANEVGEHKRRPSCLDDRLTRGQKLDIRAHQRTYQGAYIRTCIGSLSFSLLVMKLFSREFMSIGIVFQVYSILLCLIGYYRAKNMDLYFINFGDDKWYKNYVVDTTDGHVNVDNKYYFKTSGNYVLWLSVITIVCYIILFILLAII